MSPNRNYEAGHRLELAVVTHLRAEGYDVLRTAGSKGAVDVVAFKPGQVLLIQAKTNGTCPPAERAEVRRIAALLPGVGVPIVASRPGVTFRRLTGTGPKDWVAWTADEVGAA